MSWQIARPGVTDLRLEPRESRLPKWAQEKLEALRQQVREAEERLHRLQVAHAVLESGRDWFTITGPTFEDGEFRRLWFLDREHPFPACSLGRGDVLLVGRAAQPGGRTELMDMPEGPERSLPREGGGG